MNAAVLYEHGPPEVLRVEQVADPVAGPDEAVVRVRAVALNHLDLWVRRGIGLELRYPHIGGSDVAGEVETFGPGGEASGLRTGERVVINPSLWCTRCEWCQRGDTCLCVHYGIIGEHRAGGLAEKIAVPVRNLHRLPDRLTWEEGAAAPLVFQTAWRALVTQAELRPGESVLITGASGGVATAAVQIARLAGARVYAVTSGSEQVRRVRELGADVVYDRLTDDFSARLWADTGKRGVDVVFDSVGEAVWRSCLRALRKGGRLVTCGATTGPQGETDLRVLFWKQLRVIGSTMATAEEFRQVWELVADGRLRPVVDRVFSLEEVVEAHRHLERGAQFGKVVIRV